MIALQEQRGLAPASETISHLDSYWILLSKLFLTAEVSPEEVKLHWPLTDEWPRPFARATVKVALGEESNAEDVKGIVYKHGFLATCSDTSSQLRKTPQVHCT